MLHPCSKPASVARCLLLAYGSHKVSFPRCSYSCSHAHFRTLHSSVLLQAVAVAVAAAAAGAVGRTSAPETGTAATAGRTALHPAMSASSAALPSDGSRSLGRLPVASRICNMNCNCAGLLHAATVVRFGLSTIDFVWRHGAYAALTIMESGTLTTRHVKSKAA